MKPAEVNKTNTNIEAYFDYATGWIATSTELVSDALSANGVAQYVSNALNQLVWATPALAAQMAPKTFAVAFAVGGFTGLFSSTTMEKIFENVDTILSGGKTKPNTNFKVSLIFAFVVANKILPIPIPSLPNLYAALGGCVLGIKMSQWVSDKAAIAFAQFIDRIIPLPTCPSFRKA